MKSSTARQISKLLKMIEERQDEIYRSEDEIDSARQKLENKERGWTKARFQKIKMKYSERIRGLRGTINRLEKQRLNIERRERDRMEEEEEELERALAIEAEEERERLKKKKSKTRKKAKKKKKKKAKKKVEKKKVKKLSKKDRETRDFIQAFVKGYRGRIKKNFKKKKRAGFELYARYPFRVTVVYKMLEIEEPEGEVVKEPKISKEYMLVFSSPESEEMVVDSVEEKDFNLGDYNEIFRTMILDINNWSETEAERLAKGFAKADMKR